jgi:hypothetical protein
MGWTVLATKQHRGNSSRRPGRRPCRAIMAVDGGERRCQGAAQPQSRRNQASSDVRPPTPASHVPRQTHHVLVPSRLKTLCCLVAVLLFKGAMRFHCLKLSTISALARPSCQPPWSHGLATLHASLLLSVDVDGSFIWASGHLAHFLSIFAVLW